MKPNELRVNNIVDYCGTSEVKIIDATDGKFDKVYLECEEEFVWTEFDKIKPIPLTEEWILKFGFYKYYVTKEDNQIWRKDWQEGYFDLEQITSFYFGHPCYSVCVTEIHQLQNLYFALTNEELTIKN